MSTLSQSARYRRKMGILVLSPDEEATTSLCAALARSGEQSLRAETAALGRQLIEEHEPSVVVLDTLLASHAADAEEYQRGAPWRRIFLMADSHHPKRLRPLAPVIQKPFDASEFALILSQERELAELDRSQRRVQAQADEYALLVQASFEAIVGLGADGTILSFNPGAEQTYGYQASEIIGRHFSVLEFDPEHAASRLLATSLQAVETRRRHKDGRELLVLLSRSRIEHPGKRLAFAEVSLDITARRELERELEHSKRLATIGRISASMSHEINNPLSVIRSSAAWISDLAGRGEDDELKEAAADMEIAADRIGNFVDHVCGFARRSRPVLMDAPLRPTLEMALRMVRPRAKSRGVKLRVEVDWDHTPPVRHDAPRLAQAIINVVANAIDAAAEGGKEVLVGVTRDGSDLCLQVSDNGPGIANEIRDHLFEPFSTTKPFGQGTGLGLALSHQIMQDHNGTIDLTPIETGGTRAELRISGIVDAVRAVATESPREHTG